MEVNTTQYVKFGSKKTPHHRNKGRWLNKPTHGAAQLNGLHCLGVLIQKAKEGIGVTAKDFVNLASIFGFHMTEANARATFGHWRQQSEEKCLVFNEKGYLVGATDAPRPDYLKFNYGTGPKRWKREGMNKKVKVVNDAKAESVLKPYDPKVYTEDQADAPL